VGIKATAGPAVESLDKCRTARAQPSLRGAVSHQ